MRSVTVALLLSLVACGGGTDPAPLDTSGFPQVLGGEREAQVRWPAQMYEGRRYPLVVLLHGYGASGLVQDLYLGTSTLVNEYDYLLVIPEGTLEEPPDPETKANRFWNSTVCCDYYDSGVDDVAYLTALIDEAALKLPVDTGRIYLLGHSNGGAMSYRMACDVADRITAIASIAGAMYKDPAPCDPSEPVSALQIHGTLDDVVPYDGDDVFPSALESVAFWVEHAGCASTGRSGANLDLDDVLPGEETQVIDFDEGCTDGIDHALYTIVDGTHIPTSTTSKNLARRSLDWLFRHEKR
jgi:polyhydroxybutyrate depolymerase